MIDFTNCNIDKVAVHHVGNKTNDEALILSKSKLDITDVRLRELMLRFFLTPFIEPELFSLTFTENKFQLNPLYSLAGEFFERGRGFLKNTATIASHLFEVSLHPQIKSGDLFIVYFSGMSFDDKKVDAMGIFKSENRQPFLQLDSNLFSLKYEDGINVDKLDKGCLIFNTARNDGYRVCVVDKSNKSSEAQYWRDMFIHVKPLSDEYHNTKEFLGIAKHFVSERVPAEFEVSRTEQIDLLNRSIDYFKTHESFDKKEFEKEVFYHPEIIKSFRKFDAEYRQDHAIEIEDSFDISDRAVKKQARIFKNVLKLDRNFHIYIHGNKDMIEKGVDKDGRKYYKIYYEEES